MTTTTHRFPEVRYPITVYGVCPICGKRAQRSETFIQTDNPFNRNAHGERKTRIEITAELKADAEAWQPDFTHGKCQSTVDHDRAGDPDGN